MLADGNWHNVKEVLESVGDSKVKTVMTIRFLLRFGFVDLNKKENQVKLSSPLFKFIGKIGVL